jgi:hypothetical protein
MKPYVRPATTDDAFLLAPNLRDADVQEIKAASGLPPLAALQRDIQLSERVYVMEDERGPFGIFGVLDARPGFPDDPPCETGVIWMLGTDRVVEHRKTFLRESRRWVAHFH